MTLLSSRIASRYLVANQGQDAVGGDMHAAKPLEGLVTLVVTFRSPYEAGQVIERVLKAAAAELDKGGVTVLEVHNEKLYDEERDAEEAKDSGVSDE